MPYIKDNLPYNVPYQIYIDPSNLCNFKCNFCPTGNTKLMKNIQRPAGMMKMNTFKKFIDDLKLMVKKYKKKPSMIALFKDGEPLLNPNLPDMIRLINESNLSEKQHITSNGSLLNNFLSKKLIESGLNEIRFSIYGVDDDSYKTNVNKNIEYEKVKKNISEFWSVNKSYGYPVKVICKIMDIYSKKQIEKFKNQFSDICNTLIIEKFHKWSDSENWDIKGKQKRIDHMEKDFICAQPFSRLTVLFNGDVTPCCVDWSHKLVVGNINSESLDHIWNSLCNKIRHQHIKNLFPEDSPCIKCDYKSKRTKYDKIYNQNNSLNKIYSC